MLKRITLQYQGKRLKQRRFRTILLWLTAICVVPTTVRSAPLDKIEDNVRSTHDIPPWHVTLQPQLSEHRTAKATGESVVCAWRTLRDDSLSVRVLLKGDHSRGKVPFRGRNRRQTKRVRSNLSSTAASAQPQ